MRQRSETLQVGAAIETRKQGESEKDQGRLNKWFYEGGLSPGESSLSSRHSNRRSFEIVIRLSGVTLKDLFLTPEHSTSGGQKYPHSN